MSVFFGNKPYVHSAVDTAIETMKQLQLIDTTPAQNVFNVDLRSMGTLARVVARFSVAFFIYPRVSKPLSMATLAIGVIHLAIGLKEGYRTKEKTAENQGKWKEIEHDIEIGFVNILTAGYDFGVGYILNFNNVGVVAALAFAALPSIAAKHHASVFKKPVIDHTPDVSDLFKEVNGDNILTSSEPKAEPEKPKEIVKKENTFLDPACYIYSLARKLTLECIPPDEKPRGDEPVTNIVSRGLGTLRRLLSKQTVDAPPVQKTSEDHPKK